LSNTTAEPVPLPMQRRFLLLVIPLLILLALLFAASPSRAQAGSAYDLIAAVNNLRSSNGLGALNADGALMAAAQVQSDYMAYIGSFTHSGEGGSTPRDRAVAAGYGGSGVTENIAGGMDLSPGGAISIWSRDALHTNTMLGNYTDIGAGVANSGGVVYYTLLVGNSGGASSAPPAQVATSAPGVTSPPAGSTAAPPAQPTTPFLTSTPDAEGSIYHIVQPGENPVSIAQAYEIDLGTFLAQNDLIQNPLIFPGDKLVIHLAPTATATLDVTPTRVPTRTPRPTREPTSTPTLQPTRIPTVALPTLTPTPTPLDPLSAAGMVKDPLVWAIGVLALTGLLLIVVGSVLKRGA
jgi:uncharacterized protein YkwD